MIILASGSKARQNMLRGAGISFEAHTANLDEAAIKDSNKDKTARELAVILAAEKALNVSRQTPDVLVIGSDQTLECDGEQLSKASSMNDAREKLLQLRGKTHHLISAVAVAQNNKILWQATDIAALHMREFNDEFLDRYYEKAGDALTHCVGGYEIEGLGIQLFEKIEGDNFTIMGMPLLPLLTYLREEQGVGL